MQTKHHASDRAWIKSIPRSSVVYPASIAGVLKKKFWSLYTPIHPFLRHALTAISFDVVDQEKEKWQDFVLGKITPGLSVKEFVDFLVSKGYGNHFVHSKHDGEIVGLRHVENFYYQYHVRIFKDGEVRGHYEHTPESHPFRHIRERGIEDRSEYFYELFGDRIIPCSKD